MGVGDGARAAPRGADLWPREQKSVAGVKEWDMLQLVQNCAPRRCSTRPPRQKSAPCSCMR